MNRSVEDRRPDQEIVWPSDFGQRRRQGLFRDNAGPNPIQSPGGLPGLLITVVSPDFLVPTVLRGNARLRRSGSSSSPATLMDEDAERPGPHSHAGAWERVTSDGFVTSLRA
jgi:hypothetical protein